METLHARLTRLRKEQGLTMKALALKIGVPESTYRDWEYGGSIQGQPYVKLSEVLDVGLYELLTGKKPDKKRALAVIKSLETDLFALKQELFSWINKLDGRE